MRVTTDRKSTRLNSSHSQISYAVFCLKKKQAHDAAIAGSDVVHDVRGADARALQHRIPYRVPRRFKAHVREACVHSAIPTSRHPDCLCTLAPSVGCFDVISQQWPVEAERIAWTCAPWVR